MTHGKTYNKSPRRINHKATKSKTNTGNTALERSVEQAAGGGTGGGGGVERGRGKPFTQTEQISDVYHVLRARHNEKEMKVKPAISFKLLTIHRIYSQKIRQDSKQKNVSKQYLSSLCHKVPQK